MSAISIPKRSITRVACNTCRRKRIKCDGQRPKCQKCTQQNVDCEYATQEGETRLQALEHRCEYLEAELHKYKEFVKILQAQPQKEAYALLRRITAKDALPVFAGVGGHFEILAASSSSSKGEITDNLGDKKRQSSVSRPISTSAISWTIVGEDRLSWELITDYLNFDDQYLMPLGNRDLFIAEMRNGDRSIAQWCSPLLVNAMCAHRAQVTTSASPEGQHLAEKFLDEAKALFEREQGRASIPTVQALMLMYSAMACAGKDRAGLIYRQSAVEILNRLDLNARYALFRTEDDSDSMNILSRAAWGIFLFESRNSFLYFRPSQIHPPNMAKPFDEECVVSQENPSDIDLSGHSPEAFSHLHPSVPGIRRAAYSLAELMFNVMSYNIAPRKEFGGDDDIRTRKRFYSHLKRLIAGWPGKFCLEQNITSSTCSLRMHENEVALGIIQVLRHDSLFETPASQPGTIVKDLCLHHCASDAKAARIYLSKWPFDSILWRQIYLSMQPLVLMLEDPLACEVFTSHCMAKRDGNRTYPVCGYLLQATQAFAWAIEKVIPEKASACFEGWSKEQLRGEDLPLGFTLPH